MYVSPEIINLIVSIVSISLTVLGGGWVLFRSFEKKIDKRFDRVDTELHEIRRDIGDVKERIARLEGPTARLQLR